MVEVVAVETVPVLTDAEFLRMLAAQEENRYPGNFLAVSVAKRLRSIATLLEAVGT